MKQYPLEMALLNDALEQLRDYTFASKDKKEPRFSMAIGNTSLPDFEDLISDSFAFTFAGKSADLPADSYRLERVGGQILSMVE